DAVVASKPKSMSNIKASIDFSGYTAAELGPVAQSIHDSMTANATTFTTPPVTMTALQTLITTYDTKLVARASNAKVDVIAFNEARVALEDALGVLGTYVNVIAKGAAMTVEKSGFPSYDTSRPVNPAPPAAPTNLRLRQGELSGSIVARYKPDREGSTNEVQINTGDPNTEANWHQKGIYQGGKAEMDGLTPGAVVWVRVRTVGLRGVMGAWSDPGQIRVL
ncbi:MAG: hypothetical protein WCF18_16360, partial [Chthoniobacteraceae bacterium]